MRRTLAILLILISVPLLAQNGDWYIGQTIRAVRFVGLSAVSESELEPIVEPYVGQPFTDRGFLELQRRLYALDLFTSVLPEAVRPESGEGVIIRFTVEERPTVGEVRFVGNRRVRTADLMSEIILGPGDMITLAKRRVDEQAILDLYLDRGYPDVQISSRVEERRDGDRTDHTLIFTIDEGQRVTVRTIEFSGNTFASASTLRGRMETKAQNIFNPGVYQDRTLEEDKLRIETYYRERGYIDASVVDIVQQSERDDADERTYLDLTVYIEEGNQYTYEGVSFEGNTIFGDDELAGRIRVREGSVLNIVRLQESLSEVQDRYYQSGYIFNTFNIQEERDEQALSISYRMQITEQPRAHIENIIIRGNDKTDDEVILREIPLQVGDVFNVSRIREGIQNLNNLQFFSAINPETPQGSVEGLMDLVINVEEAQTADVTFGVAFGGGGDFPVSGQIGWSDRNFRGQGQTLGAQTQISPSDQTLSVNFLERWFAGERWSIGADLTLNNTVRAGEPQDILAPIFDADDPNRVPDPYLGYYVFSAETLYEGTTYQAGDFFPGLITDANIEEYNLITDYAYALQGDGPAIPDEYLMRYSEWSISIGGNTGYRFRTSLGTLTLSTSLRSSLNRIWDYDPSVNRPHDPAVRNNFGVLKLVNKWSISTTLDRRRGLFLSPSSGYILSQGVTFAGGFLFGDRHYIRTDSKAEVFFTLWDVPVLENWNWKTVLALHSDVSFVLPTFWLPAAYQGSDRPIAGPDLLATNQMFIARGWPARPGNEALWNNWVELRTPIAEQVIWTDTFFDAVAAWEEPSQIGALGPANMMYSLGAGLRFTIPQFPIRLYLTKRFRIDESGIRPQQGSLFNPSGSATGGLDFVFAIGADLF